MALRKAKPTSAGRRFVVQVSDEALYKGRPQAGLTASKHRTGGRNNAGRTTTRHRGGGHRQHYRLVDFKRDKEGVPARVERLEYDPNRSANLALLLYADGERRYIIAPRGLRSGDRVVSSAEAAIRPGNCLPLAGIPIGTSVHCVEMRPGKGGQLGRSAGVSVRVAARAGDYVTLRLRSGEARRVHVNCRATIGEVGNSEHSHRVLGKAGAKRWRGRRPRVRGVSMNPVDHPHGGGEGRTNGGRHPSSPWGWKTKGLKTRTNKRSDNMIVQRRSKRKKR